MSRLASERQLLSTWLLFHHLSNVSSDLLLMMSRLPSQKQLCRVDDFGPKLFFLFDILTTIFRGFSLIICNNQQHTLLALKHTNFRQCWKPGQNLAEIGQGKRRRRFNQIQRSMYYDWHTASNMLIDQFVQTCCSCLNNMKYHNPQSKTLLVSINIVISSSAGTMVLGGSQKRPF